MRGYPYTPDVAKAILDKLDNLSASAPRRYTIEVTTDAEGDGEATIADVSGEVMLIAYRQDATVPYVGESASFAVDIPELVITVCRVPLWVVDGESGYRIDRADIVPRLKDAVYDNDGNGSALITGTYAPIILAGDDLRVSVSGAGVNTTGTFYIVVR